MAILNIQKTIYPELDFKKVVKTEFTQLVNNQPEEDSSALTVDDFFQLYDGMFYNIPKEGDVSSHRYLINRSSEYLGLSDVDIDALLAEITILRNELLEANKTINDLIRK